LTAKAVITESVTFDLNLILRLKLKMDYTPRDIEQKWQQYWEENDTYKVSNQSDKPKYYVLNMFPYPSGAGLHVGHPLGYIASDIFARYKRQQGFNVLNPMGYDAFGLPAEEYALQTGIHPAISTNENIKRYNEQLRSLGFSFDWSREVRTCDPKYYKWTQWIFTELFHYYYDQAADKALPIADLVQTFEKEGNTTVKAATTQEEIFDAAAWSAMSKLEKEAVLMRYRLAYREVGYVNWCEALATVLANDQVKDGISERGGHPVIQKAMPQWNLRTTAYAERLLDGLNDIDWSSSLKAIQRNWIGRSEGAQMFFDVVDSDAKIEIYTTRPDTIFGATYMVLAPEHELVEKLTTEGQRESIDEYLAYVKSRSEVERMADKQVTGEFTGAYAINPFTNKKVPIWIAEYVLIGYGTGAIMAVPSDDDRDKTFAEKFGLEIIDVVDKSDYPGATLSDKIGKMINSDYLNGMEVKEAIAEINKRVGTMGIGAAKVNYKLRDAGFSRQRYWGEPFPIVYDANGTAEMLPLEELPLELPDTEDFKPGQGGQSPLSRMTDWVNSKPGYTRETDTMPAVAGSSWYFLRYMDPHNDEAFAGQDAINYWQDIDLYVGGAEHAVAHLMYSRFWHKFLYDKGLVPTQEPFKKLVNQGMIQGVSLYSDKLRSTSESIIYRYSDDEDAFKAIELDIEPTNIFVSRELIDRNYPSCEDEQCPCETVLFPVPILFAEGYDSQYDCLGAEGIKKYCDWNVKFKDAVFVTPAGYFHKNKFTPFEESSNSEVCFLLKPVVEKMSKSKYNVINPDDVIDQYGTDCFRMYEMFLGPIETSKPWDIQGISGVAKFLRSFWNLFYKNETFTITDTAPTKDELKVLHTCLKKVTADIERFSFNTCVSAFMVATNELKKLNCNKRAILVPLTIAIAPFAPHISEELWSKMEGEGSVVEAQFPAFDESHLVEDTVTYPICINGKKRTEATFAATASKDDIEKIAREMDLTKWMDGKSIRKVIVVPKRMVNIVVA